MISIRSTTLALARAGAVALALAPAPPAFAEDLVGQPVVVDGDTIHIAQHGRLRIRLFGIDAPEGDQWCWRQDRQPYPCGRFAAAFLEQRLAGKHVSCHVEDTDRYGRAVATCTIIETKQDVNRLMVQAGHALAYRNYSTRYVDAEKDARSQKAGMWQGRFIEPWNYRRGARGVD
jgi:endonuclease YncB( thermonuclease family)